jgi:hypothetical protein
MIGVMLEISQLYLRMARILEKAGEIEEAQQMREYAHLIVNAIQVLKSDNNYGR